MVVVEGEILSEKVQVEFLGQAGFRFTLGGVVVFIDPYLSDRVEAVEGPELKRQRPAPYHPEEIQDADYLLITHDHMDHCDPDTILPILKASPKAVVLGPYKVVDYLLDKGVSSDRLILMSFSEFVVNGELAFLPVPAAHPAIEKSERGDYACLGFLVVFKGKTIYHSGDTSPDDLIVDVLRPHIPIDAALLPINEKNFYRDKAGIIGNMSIREAFGLAEDVLAKQVVPMHYDMFKSNLTYLDELKVVYRELSPSFDLLIDPKELVL